MPPARRMDGSPGEVEVAFHVTGKGTRASARTTYWPRGVKTTVRWKIRYLPIRSADLRGLPAEDQLQDLMDAFLYALRSSPDEESQEPRSPLGGYGGSVEELTLDLDLRE